MVNIAAQHRSLHILLSHFLLCLFFFFSFPFIIFLFSDSNFSNAILPIAWSIKRANSLKSNQWVWLWQDVGRDMPTLLVLTGVGVTSQNMYAYYTEGLLGLNHFQSNHFLPNTTLSLTCWESWLIVSITLSLHGSGFSRKIWLQVIVVVLLSPSIHSLPHNPYMGSWGEWHISEVLPECAGMFTSLLFSRHIWKYVKSG